MCEESLTRLENSLELAVRRLRALQAANAELRRENLELKDLLEELKKENHDRRSLMDRYREERLEFRKSVEKAIRNVAALEESLAGSKAGAEAGNG